MGESYRRWRIEYGAGWESKFREKYEDQMINKLDTHVYVGTVHKNPGSWIIVGLLSASPKDARSIRLVILELTRPPTDRWLLLSIAGCFVWESIVLCRQPHQCSSCLKIAC
jgi:hypothetical protein